MEYMKKKAKEQTDFEGNIMFLPKVSWHRKGETDNFYRYMTAGS